MNQPTLHTGLAHLLEASGVKNRYPQVVFLPAFVPGKPDVMAAGIEYLIKFRLDNPTVPVIFLSFHSPEFIRIHDDLGVLELPGTGLLQLPVSLEAIESVINMINTNFSEAIWDQFAEQACMKLLPRCLKAMKHGFGSDFVNHIGVSLELDLFNIGKYPANEKVQSELAASLQKVKNYIHSTPVNDLLFFSEVHRSRNPYLLNIRNLTDNLRKLAAFSVTTNPELVRKHLHGVYNCLEKY